MPPVEVRGKNAVVIGGGSGIGRGIALALAEAGAHVAVADLDRAAADAVAAEVRARGVRGFGLWADATDVRSLEQLADDAFGAFGAVHVLSNNAGVILLRPTLEASEQDWLWVMSVNLHGIVNCCRVFAARMAKQGGESRIVNTASMAALLGASYPGLALYTASKHACLGFSDGLRAELAPYGVRVSVLCPGMVTSNLARTSARSRPAHFGGPMPEPGGDGSQLQMMPAEECGRIAVRALRDERFLILTHPETRPLVEARYESFLADYDAELRARADDPGGAQ
jgi:NAD(P)-dependent dehydrogenase (short-subunit alcohol dehydrogenase family)